MTIFIYGENGYLCRRKLKELVSAASQKELQAEYFFCASLPPEEGGASWQERMRQNRLWGGKKKLFIFLQPFANEVFQKSILQILSGVGISSDTFLFYEEGVPDARNALFLYLRKEAKCYECVNLRGRVLQEWVQKEVRRWGGSISLSDASQLAWLCAGDLWCLENEAKKLAAFTHGRRIIPEDIALICSGNLQTTIFQFIDAVAEKNPKMAITALHRKLAEGEEPLRLLGALVAQFRKMILLRQALASGKAPQKIQVEWKMHPYAFQKTLQAARNFELQELKKIYRALFAVDRRLKTGSQPGQTVLESFLLELNRVQH